MLGQQYYKAGWSEIVDDIVCMMAAWFEFSAISETLTRAGHSGIWVLMLVGLATNLSW